MPKFLCFYSILFVLALVKFFTQVGVICIAAPVGSGTGGFVPAAPWIHKCMYWTNYKHVPAQGCSQHGDMGVNAPPICSQAPKSLLSDKLFVILEMGPFPKKWLKCNKFSVLEEGYLGAPQSPINAKARIIFSIAQKLCVDLWAPTPYRTSHAILGLELHQK